MASTQKNEREPEHGLAASDDLHAHEERLTKKMAEAAAIIEEYNRGGKTRSALLKRLRGSPDLPALIISLRQLRDAQTEHNGLIMQMDLSDGSYDNATIDRKLNSQINWLRGLNIDLNKMFGTRTARRILGWFNEGMPNWLGTEWKVAKDNLKHLLTTVGVVGAAGSALVLGGYALTYGGFGAGMTALSSQLTPALTSVQAMLAAAGGSALAGWNWLFSGKEKK